MAKTTTTLRALIEDAMADWTGRDWETDATQALRERRWEDEEDATEQEYQDAADAEERAIEADAQSAADCGQRALDALEAGNLAECVSELETASRTEREYGDDPAYGPALRLAREILAVWQTSPVLVETMPAHHRESHTAAGNWGTYPANGAHRAIMSREDAEIAMDGADYDHVVRDATIADLAHYDVEVAS